ncbi:hypothetical protein BDW22DRAFT_1329938 [Trametopsis cervina]|nr:hypothetical protein BDW22DRAFT_1329938 [Trametopsis cervina]
MKMHYYLRTWRPDVAKSSGFLTSTIRQMIRYTYSTMRNKATNKVSRASGGKCEVSKPIVLWLGTRAFYTVLSCKAEAYHDILRSLEFDLGLPQYRRLGKRMKKVVKEGDELISVLSF